MCVSYKEYKFDFDEKNAVDLRIYDGEGDCIHCGSSNTNPLGMMIFRGNAKVDIKCNDCGKTHCYLPKRSNWAIGCRKVEPLTVGELVKQLKDLPGDYLVDVRLDGRYGCCSCHPVVKINHEDREVLIDEINWRVK